MSRFPDRVTNDGLPFFRWNLSGVRQVDFVMHTGIRKIIPTAVVSNVTIHQAYRLRFGVEGTDVHDLYAEPFVDCQEFSTGTVELFLLRCCLNSPADVHALIP